SRRGILTEEALFWSPRYSTRPLCLVCYGYLYSHDICHPCQCGWPLCSEECLNSIKDSDHSAECRLYASKPEKKPDYRKFNYAGIEPLYDVIAPLRLLTEKGRSNKWDTAMKLMSHLGDWKDHDAVKEQILSLFPVDYTDEEEIYTIFGIFYTNDLAGNPVLCPKIRQLYTLTSLLSHDCTPNTLRVIHSTVKEKFRVEVKAKMGIQKGEKINGTYIDTFAPTIIRKKVLRE
ncbi:Protein msta_ isoform Alike, partial [Caligus rogercresseyi]